MLTVRRAPASRILCGIHDPTPFADATLAHQETRLTTSVRLLRLRHCHPHLKQDQLRTWHQSSISPVFHLTSLQCSCRHRFFRLVGSPWVMPKYENPLRVRWRRTLLGRPIEGTTSPLKPTKSNAQSHHGAAVRLSCTSTYWTKVCQPSLRTSLRGDPLILVRSIRCLIMW
jgi:hypothetical protein